MKKSNLILGGVFIILGLISLLNNIGIINYSFSIWKFWPLFLLIPGIIFELQYFSNNGPIGLLVPGGILTTYGILFTLCSFISYSLLEHLWPIFIAGVGIGLFQLYYFSKKAKALLYISLSFIGSSIFIIFFSLLNIKGNFIFPILLLTVGGILIISNNDNDDDEPLIKIEYENEK